MLLATRNIQYKTRPDFSFYTIQHKRLPLLAGFSQEELDPTISLYGTEFPLSGPSGDLTGRSIEPDGRMAWLKARLVLRISRDVFLFKFFVPLAATCTNPSYPRYPDCATLSWRWLARCWVGLRTQWLTLVLSSLEPPMWVLGSMPGSTSLDSCSLAGRAIAVRFHKQN